MPGFSNTDIGIQQFTYNGGANQFWRITNGVISPMHVPGMGLTLRDPRGLNSSIPAVERMRVVQRPVPRQPDNSQLWFIVLMPGRSSDFMINTAMSRMSRSGGGLVLDVVGGDSNDGTSIQAYATNFQANQLWEIWVREPFS